MKTKYDIGQHVVIEVDNYNCKTIGKITSISVRKGDETPFTLPTPSARRPKMGTYYYLNGGYTAYEESRVRLVK
mgnify:CR=1 FL=1